MIIIVQIDSPDSDTKKAFALSVLDLLNDGVAIFKGDPLTIAITISIVSIHI